MSAETTVREYKVAYTAVEGEGGYPAESLYDALLFADMALAYQEGHDLPQDAHVLVRVNGGEWKRWGRLAEKAGADA